MTHYEYTKAQLKATQATLKRFGTTPNETPVQREERLKTQREVIRLKDNLQMMSPNFQTADEVFEELIQLGIIPKL